MGGGIMSESDSKAEEHDHDHGPEKHIWPMTTGEVGRLRLPLFQKSSDQRASDSHGVESIVDPPHQPLSIGMDATVKSMDLNEANEYSGTLHLLDTERGQKSLEVDDFRELVRHKNQEIAITANAVEKGPGQARRSISGLKPVTSQVYKLMEILHDNQDLAVVEKVILSEKNIFSFCNDLVSSSAKRLDGQRTIDFGRLNAVSKTVIGFYGSKDVMMKVFHRIGIGREDSVWREMMNDKLSPGLYVWLRSDSAFVFYWHEGHSLPIAFQRGMPSNFVRYLVDMCDTVCVCLEEKNLRDSFFTSIQKFLKRKRTQRLQIAMVKATENSISVSLGFSQGPKCLSTGIAAREFKWTEGSSRLALLASFPQKPKVRIVLRKEKIKLDVFPSTVRHWEDNYCLNFNKLSDDDLLVFLKAANNDLEQLEAYENLQISHQRKMDQWTERKYSFDGIKEAEEVKLRKLLANYIDMCLEIEFPKEHAFFRSDSSESKMPETDEETSLKSLKPDPEARSVSPKVSTSDQKQQYLRRLEDKINETIFGKTSSFRFVYPGAEVYVRDLQGGKKTEDKQEATSVYTMQCGAEQISSGLSLVKCMPFQYGSCVVLTCNGKSLHGRINHISEKKRDGLILNDDCATVEQSSGRKILKFKSISSDGLQRWVRSEAQSVINKGLYRNACILTSVLTNLDVTETSRFSENNVRELLESKDILQMLQHFLTHERYETAKSLWIEPEGNDHLQIGRNVCVSDYVRKACMVLYAEHCGKVESNLWISARQLFGVFLTSKINAQLDMEYHTLLANAQEEEKAYLSKVKRGMSQKSEKPLALEIETCKLLQKGGGIYETVKSFITRKFCGVDYDLSVTFKMEELVSESITWKAYEMAPLKEDAEKLLNDAEFVLSPTCSEGKDLIDLDPVAQKLLRVFFLRGGQVLVFIEDKRGGEAQCRIYLSPKGFNLSTANPIKVIRRGYEILCFDENSRFFACYDDEFSSIKVFRFDDTFHHMDLTGVEIRLSEYSVGRLQWMDFVSGRNEIAFIDEQNRVRICEVSQPAMVRPGNLHLGPSPIVKAMMSTQGSCLLILRSVLKAVPESETPLTDETEVDVNAAIAESSERGGKEGREILDREQVLVMDVYKLDDSIVRVDTVKLQVTREELNFQFSTVSFETQQHLVFHNRNSPQQITSKILKIVSATDVCEIKSVTRQEEEQEVGDVKNSRDSRGPIVDYIPYVFDKYATSPALAGDKIRTLNLRLIAYGTMDSESPLKEKCLKYVECEMERLRKEKGKDFTALEILTTFHDVTNTGDLDLLTMELRLRAPVTMGSWIHTLLCLVPIQIARAENNSLQPMNDGLQLSTNADFVDAISLANLVRFGLYEAVINQWVGPIKVISSMGKQSSGKSYLLNHLSGSLLDVAGGRCTDGIWMTVRHSEGCLYVLLDFEGLGSFERSEQEDMLLSIFNAAISNITIFNKKDFHLDKETEAIFQRFQNGVSLVKADSKLFKGLFYMAIKDVDSSDVEDLKKEFFSKISQICNKSQDNFLTKMYGGAVEISAMPFFNRPEFHESIKDIGLVVKEIDANYLSGKSFLRDVKLIISQITTKDWSSIDSKRVALRISLLRGHLKTAISMGCFESDGLQPLISFDDQKHIPETAVQIEGVVFSLPDTELELTPCKTSRDLGDILQLLTGKFKQDFPRDGRNDELWHSTVEKFISALVERRKLRISEWLKQNMVDFSSDGDFQKLKLEAMSLISEMGQKLVLCTCKCKKCFLRCVREKGHPANHSCGGDHRCTEGCTYCGEEIGVGMEMMAFACNDAAGHDGPHACGVKSHTCGKTCMFADTYSNCNSCCSQESGHDGEHRCNSRQHNCMEICSLASCKNQCVFSVDGGGHDVSDTHACHEKTCPEQCTMKECNRTCAVKDHFHKDKPGVFHHFCGYEHPCREECEREGNCDVATEVNKKTKTFKGKRSTFNYELVSEQNGKRKGCCLQIPAFKERHDGLHLHSEDPNSVHFCETRCSSCGYFCGREFGHGGLHRTTHGNMRDRKFVAESEAIDIMDRKYAWGESGVAELCNLHCKAQGRGHVHLIHCPEDRASGVCQKTFDGSRHETCKYGPDFDTPKDELTHSAYWEYMRFEDPCSADERKEFDLCNHRCKSDEHDLPVGIAQSSATATQFASYCTEPLWHNFVAKGDIRFGTGYITDDGHHFNCDHSKNVSSNVIFIIDRSGSMQLSDIRPTMAKFVSDRLGCVYEAITRFIRTRTITIQEDVVSVVLFNSLAQTVVELEALKESIVDKLLVHVADGSTTYSSGLLEAEKILKRSANDAVLASKCPTIVFLSDGGNNGGTDPLRHILQMKTLDPRLKVHTVMFGNDPDHKILQEMASVGDGSFEASLDEIQLSRRFEGLARSLKTQVVSLM